MKRKLNLALCLGIVIALGVFAFGPPQMFLTARAATADVTVTWVIPSDLSLSVSYPTALVAVRFSPGTATFAELAADSQGASGVPASFRVTNNGNTALRLDAAFTGTFPSGVAEYRIANASSSSLPSSGQIWWCGGTSDTGQTPAGACSGANNETTSRTLMGTAEKLGVGNTHDWWSWSWGVNVAAGSVSRTLTITSS